MIDEILLLLVFVVVKRFTLRFIFLVDSPEKKWIIPLLRTLAMQHSS